MGNDGGSIARRDELVKVKTTGTKADAAQSRRLKWILCHLSRQPLREPIVADGIGRLYNKEAIVNWLIHLKTGINHADVSGEDKGWPMAHIRTLKDVTLLKLHTSPKTTSATRSETSDDLTSTFDSSFACPLTGRPMNGSHRFVFILTSGAVMSEAGLKAIIAETTTSAKKKAPVSAVAGPGIGPISSPSASISRSDPSSSATAASMTFECPITSIPFSPGSLISKNGAAAQDADTVGDVILLNPPSEQEEQVLMTAMYRRRERDGSNNKKRKKKDKGIVDNTSSHSDVSANANGNVTSANDIEHSGRATANVAPVDKIKKQKLHASLSRVSVIQQQQRPVGPSSATHLAAMAARQAKDKPMSAALASIYGRGISKG